MAKNQALKPSEEREIYHHPLCAISSPFGQIPGVRPYCDCDERGGGVTKREYDRILRAVKRNEKKL